MQWWRQIQRWLHLVDQASIRREQQKTGAVKRLDQIVWPTLLELSDRAWGRRVDCQYSKGFDRDGFYTWEVRGRPPGRLLVVLSFDDDGNPTRLSVGGRRTTDLTEPAIQRLLRQVY
jgi:hypothetical protein